MKKTLIATAALLSMAGAAQAQLVIYGLLDGSYGKSIADDFAGDRATFHSGGDNGSGNGNSTSRFGIKGMTDLGSGIKANFKLESSGITSDGEVNSPFFGRQAWLGFSGGFGEVRLGRQDSIPFQTMIDLDFNGASNGVSAGYYASYAPLSVARVSRSLQYISPDFGGVVVQLGYQAKEQTDGTSTKDFFGAGAKWTAGPLVLAASYEGKRFEGPNVQDQTAFAASYDLGFVKVMGGYSDGGAVNSGGLGKVYTVGAVAPVAGFNFGAIFAKNTDDNADRKAYEFFVNKEIFKNTYAYAEYGNLKARVDGGEGEGSTTAKGKGYAVGVIFTF